MNHDVGPRVFSLSNGSKRTTMSRPLATCWSGISKAKPGLGLEVDGLVMRARVSLDGDEWERSHPLHLHATLFNVGRQRIEPFRLFERARTRSGASWKPLPQQSTLAAIK